jgi:threonine/homoserine/homoserine lactone efflux protein
MGVTASLGAFIMRFEPFISMAGALYILWLAGTCCSQPSKFAAQRKNRLDCSTACCCILMNPKVII